MLKAKHNIIIYPFFKWYARVKTGLNFKPVKIIGKIEDPKLPVLLITNHSSWWDGFWAEYVNQKVFNRKFHFMMLEEQLRRFWFFNYAGGFSVKKGSKSILETLKYTTFLLSRKENIVLVFPQGKIQSMHKQNFIFERGTEYILKKTENPVQVVFMVSMIDYYSKPKPGLYLYVTEYKSNDFQSESLQQKFTEFYHNCIEKQNIRAR